MIDLIRRLTLTSLSARPLRLENVEHITALASRRSSPTRWPPISTVGGRAAPQLLSPAIRDKISPMSGSMIPRLTGREAN